MLDKSTIIARCRAAMLLVAASCAGCSSATTSRLTPLAAGSGDAIAPASSAYKTSLQAARPAIITLPGTPHWLIYPRTESLSVSETGFTGTFVAAVSGSACVKAAPATQAAVNGNAAFTISAVAAGTCTVTITGGQTHEFKYTVYRDNWIMFGHDLLRTGNQTDAGVTLSKTTVSSLKLRWSEFVGSAVIGSSLVVDGRIYLAEYNGTVESLDAKTGARIWSITPFGAGAKIAMTPSYDNGTLFVGQHMPYGTVKFDAIGAETGRIKWSVSVAGNIRGTPAVVNGTVYIGTADGDPAPYGTCMQGGVFAINEASGAIVWHYVVDQKTADGGSVWSPISYDGSKLIFGTGNTCSPSPVDNQSNSVVALSPQTGSVIWVSNILEPQTNDNDDGAGGALWGGSYYTQSKNGNFYIIDSATGLVQAKIPDGLSLYSGAASPITDGKHVIVSSGNRVPLTLLPSGSDGGLFYGFDMSGHQDWEVATSNWPVYEMSMVNGMVLAGMDNRLSILDASTGAQLWSYPFSRPADHMWSPPVVVPSGLYAVTASGQLFAFGTDTTNSTAQFDAARPVMDHPVEQYVPPNVKKAMGLGLGDD